MIEAIGPCQCGFEGIEGPILCYIGEVAFETVKCPRCNAESPWFHLPDDWAEKNTPELHQPTIRAWNGTNKLKEALQGLVDATFDDGRPSIVWLLRQYRYEHEAATLQRAIQIAKGVLKSSEITFLELLHPSHTIRK